MGIHYYVCDVAPGITRTHSGILNNMLHMPTPRTKSSRDATPTPRTSSRAKPPKLINYLYTTQPGLYLLPTER